MNEGCPSMKARKARVRSMALLLSFRSPLPPLNAPTRASHVRHQRHGWEGLAALEFALSSLLLLTLVFGTIDLGRLVMQRTMLTNAVREAARQGSVTPSDKAAMASAANARSPMFALSAADLTVTYFCYNNDGTATTCSSSLRPTLDQLNVCTTRTFNLVATTLIGFKQITATECERANVQ